MILFEWKQVSRARILSPTSTHAITAGRVSLRNRANLDRLLDCSRWAAAGGGEGDFTADRNLFHFTGTFSLFSSPLSVKLEGAELFGMRIFEFRCTRGWRRWSASGGSAAGLFADIWILVIIGVIASSVLTQGQEVHPRINEVAVF